MFRYLLLWMSLILLVACSGGNDRQVQKTDAGINIDNIDSLVRPGDDFFQFVNGRWIAGAEIPSDQGSWGTVGELREMTTRSQLDALSDGMKANRYREGSDQRKASDFFSIGMDSVLAEQAGLKPLEPYFHQIENIRNANDMQAYLAVQQRFDGGAFFNINIDNDPLKSIEITLFVNAGGLGLPERDYYLKTDEKSKELRGEYQSHISNMLVLTNEEPGKAVLMAKSIMSIETALANASLTKEAKRDPYKLNNRRSIDQLTRLYPSIQWRYFLSTLQVPEIDSAIVTDVGFINTVDDILRERRLDDIRYYLRWRLIDKMAPYLNHALVQADFGFKSKYLTGTKMQAPRWKRVLGQTNAAAGEALGRIYVEKSFPPEAKKRAIEMVDNLRLAFADRIKRLDWMSDSTKAKALKKLSAIQVKIGYPDEWKSYAGLIIEKRPEEMSYARNVMNARQFSFQKDLDKLGKPADKKEWLMSPQTVNAYYNPSTNEIVFPAAILQPPFFNYLADEAVNYGGIGAVIGHELSHAFDDKGSLYDGEGNLKNWWTAEDRKNFEAKGSAYADQFSKYEPLPGLFIQGRFTLGENMGDLGGLNVAYDGLQRFLREHGRPAEIGGYTPEQRFFLSWGTIWRIRYREETLRTQVNTNPHSPGMFRANGPLTNMPEFYKEFGVMPGDKMYREEKDRVRIW